MTFSRRAQTGGLICDRMGDQAPSYRFTRSKPPIGVVASNRRFNSAEPCPPSGMRGQVGEDDGCLCLADGQRARGGSGVSACHWQESHQGGKTLGSCGISRNPRHHDSLADPHASPGRCRTEIPPELAPGAADLATPTACAEPELQATPPDAAGPGSLGLAFTGLGWMAESAMLGSTQHGT